MSPHHTDTAGREYERRAFEQVNQQLRPGDATAFTAPVLRIHLQHLLHDSFVNGYAERREHLLGVWGLPAQEDDSWDSLMKGQDSLERHVESAPDEALGVMLLQFMLVAELATAGWARKPRGGTALLNQLAGELGVDLNAIRREVNKEIRPAEAPGHSQNLAHAGGEPSQPAEAA